MENNTMVWCVKYQHYASADPSYEYFDSKDAATLFFNDNIQVLIMSPPFATSIFDVIKEKSNDR